MSQERLKTPESWDRVIYHCDSRVVDRPHIFGGEEREQFLRIMRLYEKFYQVKILDYCLMSNYFQMLVEIPCRPPEGMSEGELLELIRSCFGDDSKNKLECELKLLRSRGGEASAHQLIEGWLDRMWDISWFIKAVKQRFTQWYNRRNGRVGTLWECRFKRAIIANCEELLRVEKYLDQLKANPSLSVEFKMLKQHCLEDKEIFSS